MRHVHHTDKTQHEHTKKKQGVLIDQLALVVGVLQPLTIIPQIYLVYSSRDTSTVSFFMWASYDVASIILLLYGFKHKLTPIIWAQSLWLLVQTPMMISVFLF